jgi:ADP-heptose:LPS heptosyltransferase
MGVLKRSSISISNDTGPGYISAALARPTVLIFGKTNPARVMPYGRSDMVAAVDVFGRGEDISSNDDRYDVSKVTVEMVMEKVEAQIDAKAEDWGGSANC